jgi:hypothetical protein
MTAALLLPHKVGNPIATPTTLLLLLSSLLLPASKAAAAATPALAAAAATKLLESTRQRILMSHVTECQGEEP